MAKLLNKMLNFVGWEEEEEEETDEKEQGREEVKDETLHNNFISQNMKSNRNTGGNKVVNIHSGSQMKVVIAQPASIDDAQDICDHLKNKKPVVINLENAEKEDAQRIVDFLSGSVYALDGNIQKVAAGIFLIAPNNVDIMGDVKEDLRNKGIFSFVR